MTNSPIVPLGSSIAFVCLLLVSFPALAKHCLFLASYHQGYAWQDGIEGAVRSALDGHCRVDSYYLDTKRNQGAAYAIASGEKARDYIEKRRPDIVIAADDSVSRYVIKPFYKDAALPFVFCGVNWSTDAYGYPYSNVTGMLEIISIGPLLRIVEAVEPDAQHGAFIAGNVPSTRSNFERYVAAFATRDISIADRMVGSFEDWKRAVAEAQATYDFIILANMAGIEGWDDQEAYAHLSQNTDVFTVGHHEFMVRFNMLSMTKSAHEQGEWAAKVALEILRGARPVDFPIVANRRWNIYANQALLTRGGHELPSNILRKAIKVGND